MSLCELIADFCKSIILGYESGIYNKSGHAISKEKIKFNLVIANVNYFNDMYKSMIANSNPIIKAKLDEMAIKYSHNYVCLLNIIFLVSSTITQKMNRDSFNMRTRSTYMQSASNEFDAVMGALNIDKLINHTCTEIDITLEDPEKNLLNIEYE
jgi:hypothetical protein